MKEYIAEYIIPVKKKGNDYMFDFLNATPLIRCKDCKWLKFDGREYYCDETDAMVRPCKNDYCSRAEMEG